MQSRSYQELYEYVFGTRGEVQVGSKPIAAEYQEKQKATKTKKIAQFFQDPNNSLMNLVSRQHLRALLRKNNAKNLEKILFGNTKDAVIEYPFPDDAAIANQFHAFEKELPFFDEKATPNAIKKFKAFFQLAKLVGDLIEINNENFENQVSFEHAYKMLVIFGVQDKPEKYFQAFDDYLNLHNLKREENALHDALVWSLPKDKIHLAEWRKLIQISGPKAFRLVSRAAEIEAKLNGKAPANFKQAVDTAQSVFFKQADKNPELAELCIMYDVSERVFDRCLEIEKQRKSIDNLPDIVIDGRSVDPICSGYYLVKLPISDPRAFILGHLTDCCQSIGGYAEECVIDGVTRPNNGFYVLLKEKKSPKIKEEKSTPKPKNPDGSINYSNFKIVGQAYAWLTQKGNFTFDSWENLRPEAENKVIVPLLEKFAYEITQPKESTILQVTIGMGGKTPKTIAYSHATKGGDMMEGRQCSDSRIQGSLYLNTERRDQLFLELQNDFAEILKEPKAEFDLNKIINCKNMDSFVHFNFLKTALKNELFSSRVWQLYIKDLCRLAELVDEDGLRNQIGRSDAQLVALLLEVKVNPNQTFKSGSLEKHDGIPIVSAAIADRHLIVRLLINAKADVNAKYADGYCALHRAIAQGNNELVKLLLANKADLEAHFTEQGTPLLHALRKENFEIATALIEAKADLNGEVMMGHPAWETRIISPIHLAIVKSRLDMVKFLIAAGININLKYDSVNCPLAAAAERDNNEIFSTLLESKAEIQTAVECGALYHAIRLGNHEMLDALLAAKADVNYQYKSRFPAGNGSALMIAVYGVRVDMIKKLLAAKADLESRNKQGTTPLLYAATYSNENTLKFLLEVGADVTAKDNDGKGALQYAHSRCNQNVIQYKDIMPQHLDWLEKQVVYIIEQESNSPYALRAKALWSSPVNDETWKILRGHRSFFIDFIVVLHDQLNSAIECATKAESSVGLTFKFNPFEINYYRNIYALLKKVEDRFCRVSFELPDNKFMPVEKGFQDLLATEVKSDLYYSP